MLYDRLEEARHRLSLTSHLMDTNTFFFLKKSLLKFMYKQIIEARLVQEVEPGEAVGDGLR